MKDIKDQLNRIESKVDKLDNRADKVDVHLAVYNEQLKDHIRRTELLENEVHPIKDHVSKVHGALKLVASIGIITAIIKLLQSF